MSPTSLVTQSAHNGDMTDRDDVWSHPSEGDTDPGPWWTPPPASSGERSAAGDSRDSWRSSSPSWTMLVLVSAVTAVLGGTIGGVIAHHTGSSRGSRAPATVRLGASPYTG